MAQQETISIEPLVDAVLQRVFPILTQGLSSQQALWALDAYRTTVLPFRLGFMAGEEEKARQQQVEIEVDDIVTDLGELTPTEKWTAIRQQFYLAKVWPLSDQAFSLARQWYHKKRPHDELRREAQTVDTQFTALLAELEQQDPEALEDLRETISETVLDCAYVINNLDIVSFRLKRIIDRDRESAGCPQCGTSNRPGSRFCSQCGTPLGGRSP